MLSLLGRKWEVGRESGRGVRGGEGGDESNLEEGKGKDEG